MALTSLLREIGDGQYDWGLRGDAGRQQRPYVAIREAGRELRTLVPAHYLVRESLGRGNLPIGLWLAILDPDVTETPTSGLYVVLLYSLDRRSVSLSLNQGVTAASARAKLVGQSAKDLLRREAAAIRSSLADEISDLESVIDLGQGRLLSLYEAGNVAAITWAVDTIPDDIQGPLDRFLGLYSAAVSAREDALVRAGDPSALPPRNPARPPRHLVPEFKPKDASSYAVLIKQQEQVRTKTHERIVDRVGRFLIDRGFEASTRVHPIDLEVVRPGESPVLIEVKYFPAGHPREAVRTAIGQLFEYRHFLREESEPLAAVLSEHPGDAYVDLLSRLGIAVMWPRGDSWVGNSHAHVLGMSDDPGLADGLGGPSGASGPESGG